jgi:hypothetical protein
MILSIKRKTAKLRAVEWTGDNSWEIESFLGRSNSFDIINGVCYIKYYFQSLQLKKGDVAYFENGLLKRVSKELLNHEFEVNV